MLPTHALQEGLQRVREGRERDDSGEADRRAGQGLHDGEARLQRVRGLHARHQQVGAISAAIRILGRAEAGKRSTVPSLASICVSVLQSTAIVEHSEKCAISSQF